MFYNRSVWTTFFILAISLPIRAENEVRGLDFLSSTPYQISLAKDITPDGSVVVGESFNSSGHYEAFRWVDDANDGVMANLGSLTDPRSASFASAVSSDGSVVVGRAINSNNKYEAFRWVNDANGGAMIGLGYLDGAAYDASFAYDVSSDGSVVVGYSFNNNFVAEAFRWVNVAGGDTGTMNGLGFLSESGPQSSQAEGVSSDGSVVIGHSLNATGKTEAVRWVDDGISMEITGLGFLPNASYDYSYAYDVSADGSVVVGSSTDSMTYVSQAYRWVDDANGGTMTGLGFLSGFSRSTASGVSADGSVVVGYASNGMDERAFRWSQSTGMESVEDWLSKAGVSTAAWIDFNVAHSTNSDGSIIVGVGLNASGNREAFIASVAEEPIVIVAEEPIASVAEEPIASVAVESGVVGLTDFRNSLASQVSSYQTLETVFGMTLNGAHHRPLMDIAMSDGEHCGWVSADLGRIYRNGKGWTSLTEIGGCHDFIDQTLRVGVGVGRSRASIDQSSGGSTSLHGKYVVLEIDWNIPDSALIASVLAMTGRWDADIKRGYSIGTSSSKGNTDMESSALRARLDWRDAFSLGAVNFSPSMQYTHTSSRIDGYQETGGTGPAEFNSQHNNAKESRLALQGAYDLTAKTMLLGHTEWAHRFDSKGASVSGNAYILDAVSMPFDIEGNDIDKNWLRVGAEVVHTFSSKTRLSISSNAATAGQDTDFSFGVNLNMLF